MTAAKSNRTFRTRLRLVFLASVFVALCFGLRELNRPEPTFSDQPISYWMERMADPATAARAAAILSEMGPDAIPALVEALTTRTTPFRDFVYNSAVRVHLAPARSYDAANIRATAAYLLGQMGPKGASAVDPLLVALDDEDAMVRFRAQRALRQIGHTNFQARVK